MDFYIQESRQPYPRIKYGALHNHWLDVYGPFEPRPEGRGSLCSDSEPQKTGFLLELVLNTETSSAHVYFSAGMTQEIQ